MSGDCSDQLIDEVNSAVSKKQAVLISGGRSKDDIIRRNISCSRLDVSGHYGIVNYEPTELVMTARGGTRISDIATTLADHGQYLSCEVPQMSEMATIAGSLACNLSGSSRPWSGSLRDLVLGVRLINGKGEHLKFGGQVMKNVAGYDVSRLQAGALGSFGIITEVSFKVLPKPECVETVVFELSRAEAIDRMNRMACEPKPINGAAWFDGLLYVRLSGVETAVSSALRHWGGERKTAEEADAFWTGLREHTHTFFDDDRPLWRFSVKSNATMAGLNDRQLIDWCGAQRWIFGDYPLAEMEQHANDASGHVCLFRGGNRSGEVRQSLPTYQMALQKRLKNAFDPEGIFNPGILYDWL